MAECMTFPDTVEEYMEQYKIVDTEQIYTNGAEMIPLFRMKQWFEHMPERKKGKWLPDNTNLYETRFICSCCKESQVVPTIGFTSYKPIWDWCPLCGADMRGKQDAEH